MKILPLLLAKAEVYRCSKKVESQRAKPKGGSRTKNLTGHCLFKPVLIYGLM